MRPRSFRFEVELLEEFNLVSDIGFTLIGMGDHHSRYVSSPDEFHTVCLVEKNSYGDYSANPSSAKNNPESYEEWEKGLARSNPRGRGCFRDDVWCKDALPLEGATDDAIRDSIFVSIDEGKSNAMPVKPSVMKSSFHGFGLGSLPVELTGAPRSSAPTPSIGADDWGISTTNVESSNMIDGIIGALGGGGGGPMAPEGRGYVDIVIWPYSYPGGDGIGENNEQGPGNPYGVFINVNWDDDDFDGWTNNGLPPSANYYPDAEDTYITYGDDDLFYARLYVHKGPADTGPWNGAVTITYGQNIKIYESDTKAGHLPSYTSISVNDMSQDPYNDLIRYKEIYIEGIYSSLALRDTLLTETYSGTMSMIPGRTSDIVEFSVIEVTIEGKFNYGKQSVLNSLKFSSTIPHPSSSDHTGMISWDDYDGDLIPDETTTVDDFGNNVPNDRDLNCQYFANCVEFICTIKPSLRLPPPPPGEVSPLLPITFDIKRDRQAVYFTKLRADANWGSPLVNDPAWTNDDTSNTDEQLIPNEIDCIYGVDAPSISNRIINNGWEKEMACSKANFREYVYVSLYGQPFLQCSDFLKWKTQIYIKEKVVNGNNTGLLTRYGGQTANKSGTGWLANVSDPTLFD